MGNKVKRILVIDDEAVFREAMYESVTSCGYVCTAEDNPADGINRLKTNHFDLILLDIMMDPFDGWDTLEHIKKMPDAHNVPVIMASAKTLQADEIIRYGDQVAGFLKKPFESSEFCEDVRSFLAWYDLLLSDADKAESAGISRDICDRWICLSRQIRALNRLKEIVSPFSLPSELPDEEDSHQKKISVIDLDIAEKMQEREAMQKLSPFFIIRS